MSLQNFEDLLGCTLNYIKYDDDDEIVFFLSNGEQYKLYHDQNCCEGVSIEEVIGDLNDLLFTPITLAEETEQEDENDRDACWTFYKLGTVKGNVTIRWYGSSNGYYSISVSFCQTEGYTISPEDCIEVNFRRVYLLE